MATTPKAVLISDIHFNLNSLPIASLALRKAVLKAEELNVPLIIAGDLNDTKALIRAEVMNELMTILMNTSAFVYILSGNHDLVNEKSSAHGLSYLNFTNTYIIDYPQEINGFNFIPYRSSNDAFIEAISKFHPGSLVIAHQGFLGAFMGDYVQDKTSVDPKIVQQYRIISGHYHRHQNIGSVTYIGSPYTITYGEANDGPKGYLILNDDNSVSRVYTSLRRHIIVSGSLDEVKTSLQTTPVQDDDLLWLKIKDKRSVIDAIKKVELFRHTNFKLDLVAEESESLSDAETTSVLTDFDLMDTIIDNSNETVERKEKLKKTWKDLLCDSYEAKLQTSAVLKL
jgi:DNA repair exonuclease SbcCD nuclease subunit